MSFKLMSVVSAAVAALAAIGFSTPMAPAQEKKPDVSKTKRSVYIAQNRAAADLASAVGKQFKDVADFQAVADSASNTLLLSGNTAALDEVMTTLAKLDRRLQEVAVEVLILHLGPGKEATVKKDTSDVHEKDFSGPITRVLATIQALENAGMITSMRRFELKAVENQAAQLKEVVNRPYVSSIHLSEGKKANPTATRTVLYKTIGTSISFTPVIGSDQVISLNLNIKDERGLQREDGPVIGTDENNLPVRATEFVTAVIEAGLQIPNGHAVLARDVQMKSNLSGERMLVVVTAQLVK